MSMTKYAREYLLAKEQYEMAVRIEIRSAPVLEDKETFWRMIDDLRASICRQFGKRDDPVSCGVEEFLSHLKRKGAESYSFDDFPSFVATYSKLKNKLARKLRDRIEHPDNFADFSSLIDSLPLAGKSACLKIIAGDGVAGGRFQTGIVTENNQFDLVRLVLMKENFVEQRLEQKYADLMANTLAVEGEGAEEFLLDLERLGVVLMPKES